MYTVRLFIYQIPNISAFRQDACSRVISIMYQRFIIFNGANVVGRSEVWVRRGLAGVAFGLMGAEGLSRDMAEMGCSQA